MGKDRNGAYHPGKGKPSGANKEEGLGLHPTSPERLEEYLEMTEKYTVGEDELAPSVPVRHPNRNTTKGEGPHQKEDREDNKTRNETFTEGRSSHQAVEIPSPLTREMFTELGNEYAETCISFYLPTNRSGIEVNEQKDQINFKTELQTLERMLKSKKLDQSTIQRMLEPGYELLRNNEVWYNMTEGLGVFITEKSFRYVKLPETPRQCRVIDTSFCVAPMACMLTSTEYFYLLVISKHTSKLFKADAFGMQHIPVEGVPQGVDEVKRLSDLDATTFRSGSSGKRAAPVAETGVYHGVGGGNPDDKTNIAVYFETVDDVYFKTIFNKENAPLLLAGVEYLIPIYKSVCDYHNVCEQSLRGSYEHMDTSTLYKQAREVMQPYFNQRKEKALEMYGNQSASALTSSIPSDVIPASFYGRVSHLFVQEGAMLKGSFDEMANEVKFSENGEPADDLLEKAVLKTISTGGDVYMLPKENMPAESAMAAIMRY
jgi:hypothetical protein